MNFMTRMLLCFMLSFCLVEIPLMKSAHANSQQAGMITTSMAIEDFNRTQEETNLNQFLARSDVKNQLVKLGVSPEEATRRLASLSDADMKKLSKDIDHHTAGGDITGLLIVVVLVLLIVYLFKRV
jgi:hypothetical protein